MAFLGDQLIKDCSGTNIVLLSELCESHKMFGRFPFCNYLPSVSNLISLSRNTIIARRIQLSSNKLINKWEPDNMYISVLWNLPQNFSAPANDTSKTLWIANSNYLKILLSSLKDDVLVGSETHYHTYCWKVTMNTFVSGFLTLGWILIIEHWTVAGIWCYCRRYKSVVDPRISGSVDGSQAIRRKGRGLFTSWRQRQEQKQDKD